MEDFRVVVANRLRVQREVGRRQSIDSLAPRARFYLGATGMSSQTVRTYSGPTPEAVIEAYEADLAVTGSARLVPIDHLVVDVEGAPRLIVTYGSVGTERAAPQGFDPSWPTVALGTGIAVVAGLVSLATYEAASQSGGTYVVLWGAVVAGVLMALRGLARPA